MPAYTLTHDIRMQTHLAHACTEHFPPPPSPSCHSWICFIMAKRLYATKTQQTNSLTSGDPRRNKRKHSALCSWSAVRLCLITRDVAQKLLLNLELRGCRPGFPVTEAKRVCCVWQFSLTFSGLFSDIFCCFQHNFKDSIRVYYNFLFKASAIIAISL